MKDGCQIKSISRLKQAEIRLLLTCHQTDGIYKTRVKSLFFKPFTRSYHRRILFTDFSSQAQHVAYLCPLWMANSSTARCFGLYPGPYRFLLPLHDCLFHQLFLYASYGIPVYAGNLLYSHDGQVVTQQRI